MLKNLVPAVAMLALIAQSVCGQVGLRFEFGDPQKPIIGVEAGLRAQQEAGDVFVVRVEQVITFPEQDGNGLIVKANAKIDSVVRSTQPRRVGDDIVIRYRTTATTQYENQYDPRILSDNEKMTAYLKYSGAGKYYGLAAGQFSFTNSRKLQREKQLMLEKPAQPVPGKPVDPYNAKPVVPAKRRDPYEGRAVTPGDLNDPYAPVGR